MALMPRPTKRQSVYMAAASSPRMHKEMARLAREYRAAGFQPPRQSTLRSTLREQERSYLLAAARADHRRGCSAKTRDGRRASAQRHLRVVYGIWLLLMVSIALFGMVAWWFFMAAAVAFGLAWSAMRSRRVRTDRAEAVRIATEATNKRLAAEAPAWATWADENDLPASAEVWRTIAAGQESR